jgi:glycosyltransferase involved in cell wall biosynthesis
MLRNVIAGLANEYSLEFFIPTDERPTKEQIIYLEEHFGKTHIFPMRRVGIFLRVMRSLFSKRPWQVTYYTAPAATAWFDAHWQEYDAIYIHEIRLGEYALRVPSRQRGRVVIDFNDAISRYYRDAKKFASPLWRVVYGLEEKKVREYERLMIEQFSSMCVITEKDKEYLQELASERMTAIQFVATGYGVPDVAFACRPQFEKPQLCFMGNLRYPQNTEALTWFLKEVWPLLVAGNPDITCIVIGKGKELFSSVPGVTFTGFVEDHFKYLEQSALFIAPLRFGGGIPTKVMEAMAAGLPVLTTPAGANNIEGLISGENILIENLDPRAWASRIAATLEDVNRLRSIGARARDLMRHSSDAAVQGAYRTIFERLL